ncbi:hypothetical protein M407DRAFT_12412 [Tulasnella calospora MUT 4182]|uniref:Uncharacterized protein n=1 Tax=Tulasnella calospora MUT 4182 TaxID=1051891 RepID=A0A0C3K7A7_9AGAM|nr:hypothetical protein M407DRAFT_12412 [Tulasnella calospora MUT 4182]
MSPPLPIQGEVDVLQHQDSQGHPSSTGDRCVDIPKANRKTLRNRVDEFFHPRWSVQRENDVGVDARRDIRWKVRSLLGSFGGGGEMDEVGARMARGDVFEAAPSTPRESCSAYSGTPPNCSMNLDHTPSGFEFRDIKRAREGRGRSEGKSGLTMVLENLGAVGKVDGAGGPADSGEAIRLCQESDVFEAPSLAESSSSFARQVQTVRRSQTELPHGPSYDLSRGTRKDNWREGGRKRL